jgi:uncharacterized protein YcbK (DUF882 family)
MSSNNDLWLDLKHFSRIEFTCKCGCGFNNISKAFVQKLDKARSMAGVPFTVSSGCRCATHNKKVGGSPTSSHKKGVACDIIAMNSENRQRIVRALFVVGFKRVGIEKHFIHVDIDPTKSDSLWLYNS